LANDTGLAQLAAVFWFWEITHRLLANQPGQRGFAFGSSADLQRLWDRPIDQRMRSTGVFLGNLMM
jgi:hypothetical protein